MHDIKNLAHELAALETTVTLARLPEVLMNSRECFRLQIKSLANKFSAEADEQQKKLYFSAVYQLTRFHHMMMEKKISSTQSAFSYLNTVLQQSPEEAYLKRLGQFLESYAEMNAQFCLGPVANNYVAKKGTGEALAYELADGLAGENTDPAGTINQWVRRLFVLNHFQTLQESLRSKINTINYSSAAMNATLLFFNPPVGMITTMFTLAALPTVKEDTKSAQRSLHRVTFEHLLPAWRSEVEDILTNLTSARAAFDLLPEGASEKKTAQNIL